MNTQPAMLLMVQVVWLGPKNLPGTAFPRSLASAHVPHAGVLLLISDTYSSRVGSRHPLGQGLTVHVSEVLVEGVHVTPPVAPHAVSLFHWKNCVYISGLAAKVLTVATFLFAQHSPATMPALLPHGAPQVAVATAMDRGEPVLAQAVEGVTLTLPLVVPAVAVMLLVPCPLVISQPNGTLHS